MKVFVTGATGVLGQAAAGALLAEGHHVLGIARSADKASALAARGITPVAVSIFDPEALAEALVGCDAVCNLATSVPVGTASLRRGAWKVNDRLRLQGSRAVGEAARRAGVGTLVQESSSLLYADAGDDWIDETADLWVTRTLESSAVAETRAEAFAGVAREAVVLRFGRIVGDDATTRWMLSRARSGHGIGTGSETAWAHLVHPDDVGTSVVAALHAPTGVYNVGAEPLLRGELHSVIAEVVEREKVARFPRLVRKIAAERLEPTTRSHRVSSEKLHMATGWKPVRHSFDASWLAPLVARVMSD